MNKFFKCLFVFSILLVSIGVACASDDIALDNETSIVGIDNTSVVLDNTLGVKGENIEDDLLEDMDDEAVLSDSSNDYEIITSDNTKYDFKDAYKVQVVDESGLAVFGGRVDFYVNHTLVSTSNVDLLGFASFNLNSYIKSSGTYDIGSIYSTNWDYGCAVVHQSIFVDDVPMDERDIQIYSENIKLYELGEKYSVRVVDKQGNPVRKGNVMFIAYDRIFYSNISESGIASFYIPSDLNITVGHLLVWTVFSDGQFNNLATCEQITIGTRTTAALDKSSLGSRMMYSWNRYNFTYSDEGMYIAPIKENVNLVLDLTGKCYLMYENTINTSSQLSNEFSSLASSYKYDVVKLNLLNDTTYTLKDNIWEDQEWYYASRVANGQLIVNGNGATIKPHEDASSLLNFMYIGREANVNFVNVNLNKFNHVFINHGNLLCEDCIFRENRAYKLDVKLSGSGTVVHNYNTVFFDGCGFFDNKAEYWGFVIQEMDASILYAEPYSVNLFRGFYGSFKSNSLYCCNFTTTIFFGADNHLVMNKLTDSVFDQNSYFATVDSELLNENRDVVINVRNKAELMSAFYMLNSFITASKVTINLAPGTYEFTTDDVEYHVRAYNYRHMQQDPPGPDYTPIQDKYLLDVGYCPVTINAKGAKIKMTGNDDDDDYHFAYIGKFGSLKIESGTFEGFNTAFFVTGNFEAYNTIFRNNVIDYSTVHGDYGGVFRSHGGKITCSYCSFEGNRADNIGDYSTSDFYADMSSTIDLIQCEAEGYMDGNSYLKADWVSKNHVDGATYYEKYETSYTTDDFKVFNVSDSDSYNKLRNYFSNHKVKSLYVNFTGDYSFDLHPVFDRGMAIVFNSNGYNVKFNRVKIESPSTMTFIGFDFDNLKVEVKGTATFINCKFHNNDEGDYFFSNEGSCTLFNCDFYDNEGDDSIIYSKGSLTIYDSSFRNNEFDDDYGVIYNYGGSVSCINTTFSGNTEGKHIFNFASGNCVYTGSSSDVEFDEAWANWKAGLVQGAFLLGTALATYGAGTAVGAFIPGVAGLVIASVAGAGIGAASGLTYGLIEGNVYHDYSNVWKHTLTFAFIGLGFAQSGFAAQANFIRQVDEAFNNRPNAADVPGGQAPQAPQNPPGAGGLNALNENPAFQAEVKGSIEADIEALINSFGNQYNQFINHVRSTLGSLAVRPNVNMQELLTLYSTMQTILARQQVVPADEVPINIINRVANNQNPPVEADQLPPAANIIPLDVGNVFINDILDGYILRTIENNPNINYLTNRLNMNSYRLANNNHTHAERVMNLLINFNNLYNRARNYGFNQLSTSLSSYLRLFDNNIGQHGHPRTINTLFNFNNLNRIAMWERIYESASYEFNRILNASNIGEFDLDGNVNITSQLESRISNLINQLDKKFEKDPDNLDKYNTLKDLYGTTNHTDLDVMLRIYRGLSDLAKIPQMDMVDYNNVMSYDYISLVKDNIYYGVFYRPNGIAKITSLTTIKGEFEHDMKLLRQYNETLYTEILSDLFEGKTFENWQSDVSQLNSERAVKTYSEKYKQIYDYLNILYRKGSAINQRYVDIFSVKNLFYGYLDLYNSLSNSDKIILNRYFYDQCTELIKSYNGLHYMHGLEDQSENFKKLSNISVTSSRYFEELINLYIILSSSKGVDNLFNKSIDGLTSKQIGDMIIEDLISFYQRNYECMNLISKFHSQNSPKLETFALIGNWMNTDSIDELKNFYNTMASFCAELNAVYTIQKQFYFRLPIDIEYYKKNIVSDVAHRDWLSNDLQFEISTIFGFDFNYDEFNRMRDFVVFTYVDNLQFENMTHNQAELEKCAIRTFLYIEVYNQYLKNPDLAKSKMNLIEYILEAANNYPLNVIVGDEFASLVNLNLNLSLDNVSQLQQNLDPTLKSFDDIDVAHFEDTLRLLKSASPVTYWMLMDHIDEKYGKPTPTAFKWVFNNHEGQFCLEDKNGVNVTYFAFLEDLVNTINYYFSKLGIIDGNHLILKGPNYNVARLVDTKNLFNNVFNKKAYYNQMELTDENVKLLINEMKYDLNYLKQFKPDVYDAIMELVFDGNFPIWQQDKGGQDILDAYNNIFDILHEFRDNAKVLENEINVLINYLNNNTIKNLKNNTLTSTLRSNLLYFIYFWEVSHMNTGEGALEGGGPHGERISLNLLEASLEDIYKRYNEILNKLVFHNVFDDNVDLNNLTLNEMRALFLNNLYRAFSSPQKYAEVFETLEKYHEMFSVLKESGDFKAYEDFINEFDDLFDLIDWYDAIRKKINPPKDGVKPIPIPKPVTDSTQNSKLNEMKKIILDENIPDEDAIYTNEKEQYFMGSWKLFVEKYRDISDAVLKDLMNGDMNKYIRDKNRDFAAVRQDIVKFLENYLQKNNQPVKADSSITKSQFEEIKKIMEDCTIVPVESYNVISDEMVKLYGSWEKIMKNYPDVANKVTESLFNGSELSGYASHYGTFKNNYKDVREKIIEFIRINLLKEDAPDVDVVVNPVKVEVLINGKAISQCSVDEVYEYALNKILSSNVGTNLKKSLIDKVDAVFNGYIQYVDLMKSANISENEYSIGFNQFKIRFVDILKELNSKNSEIASIMDSIKKIMEPKNEMVISLEDFFLKSWLQLEKEYPDVTKHIFEFYFQNNMDNLKSFYFGNDVNARNQIIVWAGDYLYNTRVNPVPVSNPESNPNPSPNLNDEYVLIKKESFAGATLEQILAYMQNAVEKANKYVEQIRNDDPKLADSLKNKIDKLYAEYKVHVESYSHQYQYVKFMDELNKLFEDISISSSVVYDNPQANKYHIKKQNLTVKNLKKIDAAIRNAMNSVKKYVNEIKKTNKKLGQWIQDEADYLSELYTDLIHDDLKNYDVFINDLNKLFRNSIGFSSSNEIDGAALKTMANNDILSIIKMKIYLNPNLEFSGIFSEKLNQPDVSKKELIDIFNALNKYIIKESNVKMKNKILTESSSSLFKIKTSEKEDVNKVRESIKKSLETIKTFFPNLYAGISELFRNDLNRLSELSLNRCLYLSSELNKYCNNYFDVFGNSAASQNAMDARNVNRDYAYDLQIGNLTRDVYNFFESSHVYFLRSLDNCDADTIKQVIISEMNSMRIKNSYWYHDLLQIHFNGCATVEEYFELMNGVIPAKKVDEFYQNLYRDIYNEFKSLREILDGASKIKDYDGKLNYYIKSFEKIHNVDLSSDAAKFTRTLLLAIMNINDFEVRHNLTNMLLQGLNKDGSLNNAVKLNISSQICKVISVSYSYTFEEADIEMLVEIMTSNFNPSFMYRILTEGIYLIHDEGTLSDNNAAKNLVRYNFVLSYILKSRLLFGGNNAVLYAEELDLLNDLSALRCYKIMNEILQLKLNGQYSKRNTVKEGLIPGLNDIINSREYKALINKKINAGDQHINPLYSIFNKGNVSGNKTELINLMDAELKILYNIDPNLHMDIMGKLFKGYVTIEDADREYNLTVQNLVHRYFRIADMLNYWRNSGILNAVSI